ncbi:MAG: hypothetical protein ABF293_12885 [Flavobacteriaceae bacterium]
MKQITLLAGLFLLVGIISCRDTKKEQQEIDQMIEQVETIEKQIEETATEVDQKAEELQEALKALDSI